MSQIMKEQRMVHSLNGSWSLSFTMPEEEKVIQTMAQVPGNVEPVLVELGLIEDYMPADNVRATEKFQFVNDWTYTTTFDAPILQDGWTRKLVFEGIDTLAEIYLNGEKICDCSNMHMAYKMDVSDRLLEKGNELKVIIRSAQQWAREHFHDMYSLANGPNGGFYDSQSYLRKARHQWGWDNAPRVITSGIIRSVYLEEVAPYRFEDVYLYTKFMDDENVNLGVNWIYHTEEKHLADHRIRLSLLDESEVVHEQTWEIYHVQGTINYSIPKNKVKLWWPSGFGEPYMYTVRLEMLVGDEIKAVYESDFGIRTLKLEHTDYLVEHDDGKIEGEFVFLINGEKIFIRGANWKPLDPLASIADKKTRDGKALEELKNLGCNMVRIWGGGIYEDDYFYDYCDRNGIMIWHDFMLACEIPAADESYCRAVAAEAQQVIKRLRNHASLATWCGDNENDQCMMWKHRGATPLPSDSVITRKILRDAVIHFDPCRTYVESSPIVSDITHTQIMKGHVTHHSPEMHLYPDTRMFAKSLRDCRSFFIGETGPIKVNAIAVNDRIFALNKARAERLWDAPEVPDSMIYQLDSHFIGWRHGGKEVCLNSYDRDFTFAEWKDYTLAVNVICAEVFKDVLEYSRVQRWNKTGVLWWSLMDMWPMMFNYSVIDCDGHRKLPYYWIRQSQQVFALMAVRKECGGELVLYAVNDTLQVQSAEYTVTAYEEDGSSKVIASGICRQDKNSVSLIQRIAESDKPQLWIIRWTREGKEYTNHVFTGKTSYEVTRRWVQIIGEKCGFVDEILELQ